MMVDKFIKKKPYILFTTKRNSKTAETSPYFLIRNVKIFHDLNL